ncbi:hypothetical protein [Nocardia sp. NPDC046763]|uniref:hypothetical protein n=1 Tax=Nocardia sp. NPDC046763 TaxID=3155256 RepID=UPI0033DF1DC1
MTDKIYNPWVDLSRQAHHGGLHIEPGIAKEAAGYAADVVYALTEAKKSTKPLTEYTGFSNNGVLQSALNLMDRYKEQGSSVDGIIDHHVSLLTSLADTLIAAGKVYDNQDQDSKATFNNLLGAAKGHVDVQTLPKAGTTEVPYWSGKPPGTDDPNLQDMNAVAQFNSKGGGYGAIGSEDPGMHRGKWFFDVRDGIDAHAVADSSAAWKTLAGTVDASYEQLTERMKRIQESGNWGGDGVDGAMSATARFVAESSAFTTDLKAMAESVLYFSGTLFNTVTAMNLPSAWNDSWANTDTEVQYANQGKAAFTSFYIPGLAFASGSVPKLHDPTAQPTQDPSWSPRSDYSGTGPDSRSGGPHGGVSPTGSGTTGAEAAKKPGGKTGPKGTHPGKDDPHHKDPKDKDHHDPKDKDHKDPKDPKDKDPGGKDKDPTGKDKNDQHPIEKDPSRTNPGSSDPSSSNPSSSSNSGQSSALSGLQSALSSLTGSQSQTTDQKKSQDLEDRLKNSPLTNLLDDLKKPLGGSPGGGGPGGSPALKPVEPAKAQLFPRAAVADALEATSTGVARAGVAAGSTAASGMGGGGMGGMGHGGGAHGAQGKDHKRPDFLDSSEHLDEAMGKAPIVAKPVVEG